MQTRGAQGFYYRRLWGSEIDCIQRDCVETKVLHSGENGLHADQKRGYLEGARAAIYRGNPGPRAEEAAGGGRRPGSAWKERGLRSLEMTRKNDSKYGSWKPRGPEIEALLMPRWVVKWCLE